MTDSGAIPQAGRDPRVLGDSEAGFGGELQLGRKPALVMVDFVKAYFEPGAKLYMGQDSCLASGARILEAARKAGIEIVHTQVSYVDGGLDGGHFFKKVGALKEFVGSAPLGAFMPEVAPRAGEPVIVKQYASAFFGTSLASTLVASGVDTVIIAGVSTSGCIRATAVDAIQHGFVPLIARESVGDRNDGPHEASLFDLQSKYAEVRSEASVLEYLFSLE